MTIRDYIQSKFGAFGNISEAELLDMSIAGGFSLDYEYNEGVADLVGKASVKFIEEKAVAPKLTSVNEGGFSASWDYSSMGKYYLYLCAKHGVEVNKDTLANMGVKVILDKSNIW